MWTFVIAAALSLLFVAVVRHDALRRGLIDRPNDRSSHVVPTPRGGGLGLLLALGIALAIASHGGWRAWHALATALAVLLVAIVGWVDDHGGAPVRVRLVVHAVAAALLLPLVLDAPLPMAAPVAAVWWIFWTVSAINVVNFVDGIDGIIGAQALVYGLFLWLAGQAGGPVSVGGLALAGASLGFLVWNWNPAKIFMGDVGSGALGVVFVALGAALVAEGRTGFVAAFAPLAPIFLDAALTLGRRARRGERLSEAHRSHLYQRLANGPLGHASVSAIFAALSCVAAVAALQWPGGGATLLAALLAALGAAAVLLERVARPGDPTMLP